ncbi:MAG: serine hydrolase [Desulfobacterales bacterium]|nr:MAG: serine hydrolase [Desulfobacterales bacterium]
MIKQGRRVNIHEAMADAVSQNVFPGAVLIWGTPGHIMFHRAYGVLDLDTCTPVQKNTVFDLASLTKPLATTLAIAELIRGKHIDTSTVLGEILPAAGDTDKACLSVDMLLRHTSGLPAHRDFFRAICPDGDAPQAGARDVLRNMVLEEPLAAVPGSRECYSDLGFILLAWVVETVSGMRLDQYVTQNVYNPLGISGLFFPGVAGRQDTETSIAATSKCPWRQKVIQGEVEDENAWAVGGVEGHAGLFGDGRAVFTLCSNVLAVAMGEGAMLPDTTVFQGFLQKMPGMERVAGFDTPSKENSSSGRYFSRHAIGHLGFTGTSIWMDPEDGLIVVLLTNRVHPSRKNTKIRQFRPLIHDLIRSAF